MKAAVLEKFGSPLAVKEVPDPAAGPGQVIVDVVAAPVLSYASEVFSGARNYPLEPPVVPGCGAIGRVRSFGPDATKFAIGDWVFCDPTVRSRDDVMSPDITLQGWSSRGEGGLRLSRTYHNGPFAEQMMLPTENAIRIGPLSDAEATQWCALNTLLVPYGGLIAANFLAGETLVVSGATGNFGSACIAVALAMGAGCVIAPGRNAATLADLARRFGERLRTVQLSGNEDDDRERMRAAAPGPIDCVLDILPPSVAATTVQAALMTVRPYGRVVLMGGVGMLGGEDLKLPYPWIMRSCISVIGQWMYSPDATIKMARLVRAGLLDLSQFAVKAFPLADVNEAIEHAAANHGPFKMTVIQP